MPSPSSAPAHRWCLLVYYHVRCDSNPPRTEPWTVPPLTFLGLDVIVPILTGMVQEGGVTDIRVPVRTERVRGGYTMTNIASQKCN